MRSEPSLTARNLGNDLHNKKLEVKRFFCFANKSIVYILIEKVSSCKNSGLSLTLNETIFNETIFFNLNDFFKKFSITHVKTKKEREDSGKMKEIFHSHLNIFHTIMMKRYYGFPEITIN